MMSSFMYAGIEFVRISATWLPRQHHAAATSAPHDSHVSAMWHPRQRHVAANSSLLVTWRVNPWRSLSSQILGFRLGSMGFTPIYDGMRTSWITQIYDENLRTSREGIRDAQYMTFSNFVIDVILWRNFDDPWRKLTVIDHEIFCSVYLFCKHLNSNFIYNFDVSTISFFLNLIYKFNFQN
jgi:hypothetical protein